MKDKSFERLELLWEQWNTTGVIPQNADFDWMVSKYQDFKKMYEIFAPKTSVSQDLYRLETIRELRRKK